MNIYKEGKASAKAIDAEKELEAINRFAKTQLNAEQIYTFSVVLCDNEVDRDCEKFSCQAIEELSRLFVGRTGIFDHEWKSANQTARIYRTEIIDSKGVKNSLGEPYQCLKGYAYMLRSEKNAELIEEIEAGIKKETSIGCSVSKRSCSICGAEIKNGGCGHIPGREYKGEKCYVTLEKIDDAYEWSFVAVPAQRKAGVVKRFGNGAGTLKEFVAGPEGNQFLQEFEALEKQTAAAGEYMAAMRSEVVRLGLLCDRGIFKNLEGSVKDMDAGQLSAMKELFEKQEKLKRQIIDGYGSVTAQADADDPTVCRVSFEFSVAHGLNRIYLSANINV